MVQDPLTAREHGVAKTVEGMHLVVPDDSWIGDGPSTHQIAVVDLDLRTGVATPPAVYEPPAGRRKMGRFRLAKPYDLYSPEFIQVAAFAAAAKTIRTMDLDRVLGHPMRWRDPGRPLRILPRAGRWANARYDRDRQELQFFYFDHPADATQTIYTALARDIVAHECAHAVIDGIAPFLYDSNTPQTLAIHEAIADLCAVLTSFRSGSLTTTVLERTGGRIGDSTAFSAIAPQFGRALSSNGHSTALRNLRNDRRLPPPAAQVDVHRLSEVLSGLLYGGLAHLQDGRARHFDFSRSGFLLAQSARRVQRLILRALDLLPAADVSFADYLRCLVYAAAKEDEWVTGHMAWEYGEEVDFFVEEAVRRGIVDRPEDLVDDEAPADDDPLTPDQMRRLAADDDYAVEFVGGRRHRIGIPEGARFTILARRPSSIWVEVEGRSGSIDELLVKVAWEDREEIGGSHGPARERIVRRGATIVIGGSRAGYVDAVIRGGFDPLRAERDAFLGWSERAGLLTPRPAAGKILVTDVAGGQTPGRRRIAAARPRIRWTLTGPSGTIRS
ncbi:hypothetical protein [Asanoa sp. NPDC050611]|uniref:hypothetical protein n=1 Tax=Asanoa sp. NPDC050611 TaxID=3157098 RepID=UPI0033C517D3